MKYLFYYLIVSFFLLPVSEVFAQSSVPAFPGAEGFGATTPGGRGGQVIKVTNLNDSGTGSLRACATAIGPRICVFTVGGIITLTSGSIEVSNPFLTVAGQTAPGGGITIKAANERQEAAFKIKTHNVIIRYIRFRPGTILQDLHVVGINAGSTATGENAAYNIILDHISISWGADEILVLYAQSHDVTVQWSSISESLPAPESGSSAIKAIVLGADNGPSNYTLHHNLLAHNNQRNPNNDTAGVVDLVNNVIYNWDFSGANLKLASRTNLVNNYVKPGPNTADNGPYVKLTPDGNLYNMKYYLSGNTVDTSIKSVLFAPSNPPAGVVSSTRFSAPAVTTDPANQALFTKVANDAGAVHGLNCDGTWYQRPDSVDTRIAQSVINGTNGHVDRDGDGNDDDFCIDTPGGNYDSGAKAKGYICHPSDVGGWPTVTAGTACIDSDNDGMPNVWETAKGLNPNQNDSSGTNLHATYTNIEMYINGPLTIGPTPTTGPTIIPTNTPTPQPATNTPTPTPASSVQGDVNGDNQVTLVDLSTLLANFGGSGNRSDGDVDNNGSITIADLSILLANFGSGAAPTSTPTPASSGQVISTLLEQSSSDYLIQQNLQTGSNPYVGATCQYQTIPSNLLGAEYIQTANASTDKSSTASSFITFTLTANASVYIAYDDRNTTTPSWLTSSFTLQPDTLGACGETFRLYRKDYSTGSNVVLGGNGQTSNRMYSVIVTTQL
ncbi:hypothetical protein HY469_01855 [Candidatus Roizmanbacteria bacterium]|nr:hypothetical protein [Candidatus Roizmanbacteria bacterium]